MTKQRNLVWLLAGLFWTLAIVLSVWHETAILLESARNHTAAGTNAEYRSDLIYHHGFATHGGAWILGIFGLLWIRAKNRQYVRSVETALSRSLEYERELEQSQERYKALHEASFGGVLIHEQGLIIECNQGLTEMTGFSHDELIGMDGLKLIEPKFLDLVLQNISSGYDRRYEVEGVRKDGSVYPLSIRGKSTIYKGRSVRVIEFMDITEQVAARHLLELSEKRYRTLVEGSDDLISRVDRDGRIAFVNSASRRYWGLSPEECIGCNVFDFIHPADRESTISMFKEWLDSESSKFTCENRQQHTRGGYAHLLWFVTLTRDQGGQVVEVSGIGRDITERKRQEMLRESQLRLIEFAGQASLPELLQKFLEEAELLTDSSIGFYHFIDDDQQTVALQAWSKSTLDHFCTAEGDGLHYPVSEGGVWVDAVRQRQPVIHNDYESLPHKKGLPKGHAPIAREMVVPVFRGDKMVAILGVGNKPHNYTAADVRVIQTLADMAWETMERLKTESDLKASEQWHRTILNTALNGIWTVDLQGNFLEVNEAYSVMSGFVNSELLAMNIADVEALESREEVLRHIQKIVASGEAKFESRHRRKDGSVYDVEVSAKYLAVGDGRIVAMVSDISERKRAEQELIKSEERFQEMFRGHNAVMLLIDPEHSAIIDANEAALKFYGYTHQEITTLLISDINTLPKPEVDLAVRRAAAGEWKTFEFRHRISSGEIHDVEVHTSPIRLKDKVVLFSIIHNITQRKKLMEDYRRSAQLAALGTVAAGVAHEINNPIQGIINYATLIGSTPERTDRVIDMAGRIVKEGNRIAGITRDLLHYAKDNRGEFRTTDILEPIKAAISLVNLNYKHSGVSIDLDLPAIPVLVIANPQWVQQVIVNLVENSFDAILAKGDVREGESIRVNGRVDHDGGAPRFSLEVLDHGIGIPAENLGRVRDAFFTTKQETKGTGLGLSIVADIVAKHRGALEIESGEGLYTRVSVSLPLAK